MSAPEPCRCVYPDKCFCPPEAKAARAMTEGTPAADFRGHPGVNARQRARIAGAVEADPEARMLGMDENERPVVRFRAGMPREPRTVAVLKSGETTDPGRVRERWCK